MAEPRSRPAARDRTSHLTPETAVELGMILGTVNRKVGVAIDADPYSVPVGDAFISGLTSAGAEVLFAGICPAPAACLAFKNSCKLITMISCPVTSGVAELKLYRQDGSEYDSVDMHVFETSIDLPGWMGVGSVRFVDTAGETYTRYIQNSGLRITGYVILDCGCGCTSAIAPEALSGLGADVTSMDSDPRYRKPRNPGVEKSDLLFLSNFVDASTGSVGIAYNGDGTRLSVMDENGKYITPEHLLALLLMYLEPRVAVIPFDSPALIEDAFNNPLGLREEGHGKEPDRSLIREVTDEAIIETARNMNAEFAVLNDGRFIFPENSLCPDAIYASAVIAEISGLRSLRNILEELPTYTSKSLRIPFNNPYSVFNAYLAKVSSYYGVKSLIQEDRAWMLVMEGGVCSLLMEPPELRIYAESKDPVYLATMVEQVLEIIKSFR